MKLNDLMQKLAAFEPNGFPVLSIYLDSQGIEQGREDYRIWLKTELAQQSADFENESAEAQSFNEDVRRINEYLDASIEPATNGIAIFACFGADEFFETAQIEVPFPNNRLFVFDRPHIFPLVRAIEQNPKYLVLWADTNKADIYIFGGENSINAETETAAKIEEIDNTLDLNRTKVGGWSQGRYQRHVENFQLQHAKETVEEVEKLMRGGNIEHLILCGDEAVIMPILRPQLSKELEEKVVDTLNLSQYASENEIHTATLEVMELKNADHDKQEVERMFGAAKAAAKLGTLGVEDTLAALSNGQVEELFIASSFEAIDYSVKKVKKVLKAYAPGDDNSVTEALPEAREPRQIADELIVRALNSAAKIKFIEDESLLKEAGGVGAILRYNMNSTANG
jgi:peptide chain release factor subunit 1